MVTPQNPKKRKSRADSSDSDTNMASPEVVVVETIEVDSTSFEDDGRPPPRNKSEYDLTLVTDVRSYLEDLGFATLGHLDVEPLTGGTANYVYRVSIEDSTFIVKHAKSWLASNTSFELSTERMDFEAYMLEKKKEEGDSCVCTEGDEALDSSTIERTHAHTVPFHFYDKDVKILCVGDGGPKNLKDAYKDLSPDEVMEIGVVLGEWLAKLHHSTPHSYITGPEPRDRLDKRNNETAVRIAGYIYEQMDEAINKYSHMITSGGIGDTALADELQACINETKRIGLSALIKKCAGSLVPMLAAEQECVCHGDFWPGNIMLRSNANSTRHIVTVIDWELTRIGMSATDVGQFAAETTMLDELQGKKGLCAAFIPAYFFERKWSSGHTWPYWAARAAMHYAVHLVVWPAHPVHWVPEEEAVRFALHGLRVLLDIVFERPNIMNWGLFDSIEELEELAKEWGLDGETPRKY